MSRICRSAYSAVSLVFMLGACSQQQPELPAFNPATAPMASAANPPKAVQPYHIGIGDEIEVKFFFAPELNDLLQVRPDGKISLMFAQDIQAAGKTPEELADSIRDKLASEVKQSDLVVIMRSFASQKAYIGGEVSKPGPVQLTGGESIMQVLTEAGWISPTGNRDKVVLIRCCDKNGNPVPSTINIEKIMNGEDLAQNILIQAGDQIVVPPSNVTSFDRWVDQYLRQALFFSTNASVVYSNDGVIR